MAPPIGPLAREALREREPRTQLACGLTALGSWLVMHDGVPLPAGLTVRIPVPGKARGERIAELERIAEAMGVPVTSPPDPFTGRPYGALQARREFGPVTLVAHVEAEGSRHLGERMDAIAGAEAGAAA